MIYYFKVAPVNKTSCCGFSYEKLLVCFCRDAENLGIISDLGLFLSRW